MKAYTLLLDIIILSLMILALSFSVTDEYITDSVISRRGAIRTFVICWQSLLMLAAFCIFLRYIARRVV